MTNEKDSVGGVGAVAGSQAMGPTPLSPSRAAMRLLEAQERAARTLLASQSEVAERLRLNDVAGATRLAEAQERAARTLLASQSEIAELLRSADVEGATRLLEAQEEAARMLLASQSEIADLLRSNDVAGVEGILAVQEQAARTLLASQLMVAELLRSNDTEVATDLLEAQEQAARSLLLSQSKVADLLRSNLIEGAADLVEAQELAARTLLAYQSKVVERLRSHNAETAMMTALNIGLEERVLQRTEELSRANASLEAASHVKSEFLASMSHELRTPLNSIIGFSGIMLDGMTGEINDEQRRQLEMIQASGKRLLTLVNDILDLSKIEAKMVSIDLAETNVNEVCREAIENVRPQAGERGVELRFIPCTRGCSACGHMMLDRDKLMQIVLNLLSNAIKFTKDGSVECRIDCAGEKTMSIRVIDTGVGIDGGALERIFEEFEQVSMDDEAKPPGTGLGLTISRRLANLLGGELTATSTRGSGSEFTLTLPIRLADAAPPDGCGL